MKKIIYMMSLCALAFISCQKEEMSGNVPVEGQYTYEFVAYQQPESKATVGDKVDDKWPVLWSEDDQIGVYKADGTFVGAATLADGAGQNAGKFSLSSNTALASGDALYISYPYVADAAAKTGKIASKQSLGAAGVGANALAYATAQYNGDATRFVLTHANAYLKFNIKSEEFAGYNLNGVTLWATGAELSGDVTIADALTVSNAGDYVKSTLATPVAVSADNAQAVWVTSLPGNLAGKTVYAIVHMTGVEGTETATHTVTLPVKLNGAGALPAGSVTEITLPSLTKSLAPAWYEPVETRYIAAYGDGWSYGPENTVIFTDRNTAKAIDLKARGNFMKVKEPKYVQVAYLCGINELNYGEVTINGTVATTYSKTGTETFTQVGVEDAAVSIKLKVSRTLGAGNEAGYITALLIKDKDENVIWGLNLWHRMKDKEKIPTVTYDYGEVTDRNLGVDEKGDAKTWRASGSYFQWGRPFAIQSQFNAYSKKYFVSNSANAVTSLEVSAANPFTLYYYADGAENLDWYYGTGSSGRENDLDDLWGNPNTGTTTNVYVRGTKSIYDPCPKGYMVVCPTILKEVEDNYKTDGTGATTLNGTDTGYPYFTYKGIHWGFAGGYLSAKSISWKNPFCGYWSNSHIGNSGHGRSMEWASKDATSWGRSRSKAAAFPVRCMVDTENR